MSQESTLSSVTVKTEANIFADCFEDVRGLTRFYYSKLRDVDPFARIEVNGKKLNTIYWLMGHLVWAEHFLLVRAMGKPSMEIPWFDRFEFGAAPTHSEDHPSLETILQEMKHVHAHAMEIVRSLTDEELDEENAVGISFGGGNSKRVIIRHAIRHEPCHAGQLGWLCQIHHIATF